MKKISQRLVSQDVKAWFGTIMQGLAVRHDIAGPDIGRVNVEAYKKQLVEEFTQRTKAAIKARELVLAVNELDGYCTQAAEELIHIRQIRAAHDAGELSTEMLRQLPLYPAYSDYFNETPSLVYGGLFAATQQHLLNWTPGKQDASPEPLSNPGHPRHPVSKQTRSWMELQVLGLACADDAWGAPFGTVPKEAYITDCTVRLRKNARRAIQIGDLHVPTDDVDKICWVAACEAYLLRSLKAAKDSGELTDKQIKAMPIYGPYHEYFEIGFQLAAMAETVADSSGVSIRPPGAKN